MGIAEVGQETTNKMQEIRLVYCCDVAKKVSMPTSCHGLQVRSLVPHSIVKLDKICRLYFLVKFWACSVYLYAPSQECGKYYFDFFKHLSLFSFRNVEFLHCEKYALVSGSYL